PAGAAARGRAPQGNKPVAAVDPAENAVGGDPLSQRDSDHVPQSVGEAAEQEGCGDHHGVGGHGGDSDGAHAAQDAKEQRPRATQASNDGIGQEGPDKAAGGEGGEQHTVADLGQAYGRVGADGVEHEDGEGGVGGEVEQPSHGGQGAEQP